MGRNNLEENSISIFRMKKLETKCTTKTFTSVYQSTWHHIPTRQYPLWEPQITHILLSFVVQRDGAQI